MTTSPSPPLLLFYPHLTLQDFTRLTILFLSSQSLLATYGISNTTWVLKHSPAPPYTRQPPIPYLELRKYLPRPASLCPLSPITHAVEDDDADEANDDPEALPPTKPVVRVEIVYHIVYSTTYRLPVLYFSGAEVDVDVMLQKGVVGQGEHPLNGEAGWWFVHPCRTAESMDSVRGMVLDGGKEKAGERYIGVWLGFVGDVAGLLRGKGIGSGGGNSGVL